ncbi:MAG TPA: hypothetical protein ENJ90_04725 [Devosia sp.]|nr:hypothetical protein [Devosia sp.]
MNAAPLFASDKDYAARLSDVDFWLPHVEEILHRHGFFDAEKTMIPGIGSTCPSFIVGNRVIKLFGHLPLWQQSFAAERSAHNLIATDHEILAPRLLAQGALFADGSWPYLVTSRMQGTQWHDLNLSPAQKSAIADELGTQIKRIHTLPLPQDFSPSHPTTKEIVASARASVFPAHLIDQIEGFLTAPEEPENVFVHGDIFTRHVFVKNDRLTGIIDWGDARIADRHFELAKIHLNLFACDKGLLRAFLEAANWPVGKDFARRCLAQALRQNAIGQKLHLQNDTFFLLPDILPLREIKTLDELADQLFAV